MSTQPCPPDEGLLVVPRRGQWAMMISLIFIAGPAIDATDKLDGVLLAGALELIDDGCGGDGLSAAAQPADALPDVRVVAGDRVLDPALAAAALAEGESPLTPRETEVLGAARGGEPVLGLAGRLHLPAATVRNNYLSSAMQKLGAHSRAEAVRVAEDKGWL